uniref:Uncharacterized protein n=1 Tax=Octopus bimaculoides TaxID=37653 RepID=A0A0L8HVF1_OCTBM
MSCLKFLKIHISAIAGGWVYGAKKLKLGGGNDFKYRVTSNFLLLLANNNLIHVQTENKIYPFENSVYNKILFFVSP